MEMKKQIDLAISLKVIPQYCTAHPLLRTEFRNKVNNSDNTVLFFSLN